jgi:hypothetical protein
MKIMKLLFSRKNKINDFPSFMHHDQPQSDWKRRENPLFLCDNLYGRLIHLHRFKSQSILCD